MQRTLLVLLLATVTGGSAAARPHRIRQGVAQANPRVGTPPTLSHAASSWP